MGLFDFLGGVKQAVGSAASGVGTIAHNAQQGLRAVSKASTFNEPTAIREAPFNFLKGIAQQVEQAPAGQTLKLIKAKATGDTKTASEIGSNIHEAFTNTKLPPVYVTDSKGNKILNPSNQEFIQNLVMGAEGGIESVGARAFKNAAGDVVKPAALSAEDTAKLAKATHPDAVKAILQDKLHPQVVDQVSGPIALAKDQPTIQRIVDRATSPAPPPKAPTLQDIAPVATPAPAGQGRGIPELVYQGGKPGTKSEFWTARPGEALAYAQQHGINNGEIRVARWQDIPQDLRVDENNNPLSLIQYQKQYGQHIADSGAKRIEPIATIDAHNISPTASNEEVQRFISQEMVGQGSAVLPKLPAGYSYDKFGSIHNPAGKELTIGEQQDLAQATRGEGFLSDYEKARNTGDTATMQRIAAEHPNDTRVQLAPPTSNPQQTVLDAINGTNGAPNIRRLQTEQRSLLSTERGKRFAAAEAAGQGLEGTQGFRAELSQLSGKYTKVDWNGLKDQLGGDQAANDAYVQLRKQMQQLPNFTYTDKLNTDIALRKLILGEGLPTAGDIKRLETAFGSDFADQVAQHVSKFQQFTDLTKQLIGVPRAIMSSGDVSGGGRQALSYATAHPIEFGKQWVKQFKYFKEGLQSPDSEALSKSFAEIKAHPDYPLAKDSGLALTDVVDHNPATREEQYIAGNLAEKIPVVGRLVRGSDYAFTGLLNNIRANSFYSLVDQARAEGYVVDKNFASQLAKVVNNGTGRGTIKALEQHMGTLSTALFSPRLMLSRLQTFNPLYYIKTNPVARREALRQLFGLGALATSVLGIAKLAGLQVGTNPLSADFGKVKVGDTRIDFMGGYTQYLRLGAQLATGTTVSSVTGHASQLGQKYGSKSRKDIIYNFLENKENPVLSFITTLIQGKDAVGNDIYSPQGLTSQVVSRFTPLVAQDVADMLSHPNGLNPAIGGALSAAGIGTQTYGQQDIKLSPTQQKYVDSLTADSAPAGQIKATTEFYQVAHTVPDRTATSDEIKAALKSDDFDKATTLMQQYNEAYQKTFTDWANKYDQYAGDPQLVKDYQAGKITPSSLTRWYTAIKQNP